MQESDNESNNGSSDELSGADFAATSEVGFPASSEEEDNDTKSVEHDEEVQPAKLKTLPGAVTEEELQSNNTELILFRVPRHGRLKSSLKGSELNIPVARNVIDKKAGIYQGSYVFRDRGTKTCKHMRPVFVTKDSRGDPHLHVGKEFSRFITVTFDMPLSSTSSKAPKPRVYAKARQDLKLKYHPIGKVTPKERLRRP